MLDILKHTGPVKWSVLCSETAVYKPTKVTHALGPRREDRRSMDIGMRVDAGGDVKAGILAAGGWSP